MTVARESQISLQNKISSPLAWLLVVAIASFGTLGGFRSAAAQARVVQAPGTESSAGGATDAWLVERGLIGRAMVGDQAGPDLMIPAGGVEVEETRQTEDRTGTVVKQGKLWEEKVGDDTVHIEVTTLSSTQFEVSFWLFPNHRRGCK